MDFYERKRQWETAADALLAAYGERRRLREIRAANRRAWERHRRRARMKVAIGGVLVVGAVGVARAATLLQSAPSGKHPLLEWAVPLGWAGAAIVVVTTLRVGYKSLKEELSLKADSRLMDERFRSTDRQIEDGIKTVIYMVETVQQQVSGLRDDVHRQVKDLRDELRRRDAS